MLFEKASWKGEGTPTEKFRRTAREPRAEKLGTGRRECVAHIKETLGRIFSDWTVIGSLQITHENVHQALVPREHDAVYGKLPSNRRFPHIPLPWMAWKAWLVSWRVKVEAREVERGDRSHRVPFLNLQMPHGNRLIPGKGKLHTQPGSEF